MFSVILSLLCSGLIDEGESAEAAALRELKEETGYKGEVVGITPGIIAQTQAVHLFALTASLGCILSPACVGEVQGSTVQSVKKPHTHFYLLNTKRQVIMSLFFDLSDLPGPRPV